MLGVVKSVEVFSYVDLNGVTELATSLTKGQNTANCVPFVTKRIIHNSYAPETWMTDCYFSSNQVVLRRTSSAARLICSVVVVEFDPNKVRVQQKSFTMPLVGGSSVQTVYVNLDHEITSGRAAMVHHYRQSTGTQDDATDWAVRRNFSGTTQAQFTRRYSDETAQTGNFYVFESLDGAFTTQRVFIEFNSGVNYNTDTITEVDMSKSWIVPHSFYSTRTHPEADANFMMVEFQSSTVVEGRRRGTTSYIQVDTFVVEHHDDTSVTHGQFDFGSGDTTDSATVPEVDTNFAAPLSTARDGGVTNVPATYAGTDYRLYLARVWYSNSTTINAERQQSGEASELRYQSIEFAPAPGYYFGGYVTEQATPADPTTPVVTTVRCYRRDTGELTGETTSSGIGGYYYLETTHSGSHYVVALDPAGGESYNILGYDLMVPTTISGG
jgi:hypothetical protein